MTVCSRSRGLPAYVPMFLPWTPTILLKIVARSRGEIKRCPATARI